MSAEPCDCTPGPLVEAIAQALDDRGHPAIAADVRDREQDIFDQYVGPLLDQLEADYQ